MQIVDLSRRLFDGMPVFPGHPGVQISEIRNIPEHGRALQYLQLTNHAGTHLDAPAHFLKGGATSEMMPLGALVGPATIIDLSAKGKGDTIAVADLLPHAAVFTKGARVILMTGWGENPVIDAAYYQDFPTLTREAAEWIAERGIALLGMDTPSPGPAGGIGDEIHKTLLAAGVIIMEALCNLALIGRSQFSLVALPLPISSCSGAPCRAIAIMEDK